MYCIGPRAASSHSILFRVLPARRVIRGLEVHSDVSGRHPQFPPPVGPSPCRISRHMDVQIVEKIREPDAHVATEPPSKEPDGTGVHVREDDALLTTPRLDLRSFSPVEHRANDPSHIASFEPFAPLLPSSRSHRKTSLPSCAADGEPAGLCSPHSEQVQLPLLGRRQVYVSQPKRKRRLRNWYVRLDFRMGQATFPESDR